MSFPKYISTWPTGEDLMGLKPQETISDAIVKHVVWLDDEHYDGGAMPRVIGLEGKWGSGKSNVIKHIKSNELLKNDYHVLEFDAWSYQEDEYRKSLIENITSQLTKLHDDKKNELNVLMRDALTTYEYEKTKFEPHVSGLLIGLLITIAITSLFGFILEKYPDTEFYRYCRLVFMVIPWILLAIYALFKKKDIDDLLVVFENSIRNGGTTKSIYSRNPSVSDLRLWLNNVSDLCGKRIILVIDNMDRLPSDKLKKLWSMIQIFANDDRMKNAWFILPYDLKKLKSVIGDEYKQYLRKTIPVTINVGEPIVSDSRDVFDGLFEKAFGKNVAYQNEIRAMFLVTYKDYSIRDIIYFLNSMVSLKKQNEQTSLVSIAIYVLMEEELKECPEGVLLEDWFAPKYSPIVELSDEHRCEVAAIVYHVSKDDAMQVVFENALEHAVMLDTDLPIDGVKNRPDFYKVLTDYCSEVNIHLYEGYIDVLDKIEANAKDEYKKEVNTCWQHVIQFYLGSDALKLPYVGSERMKKMVARCDEPQKLKALKLFLNNVINVKENKGEDIYKYCQEIDDIIEIEGIKKDDVFSTISLQPFVFKSYLDAAKENYNKYPVVCDSEAWVNFCVNLINTDAGMLLSLCYMCRDKMYDFSKLMEKAEKLIGDNGCEERNALNAYKIYRTFSSHPVKVKPARRIAVSDVINHFDHVDDDPVFISLRMFHNKRSEIPDDMVPQIAEELLCLMHPLEIFEKCFVEHIESFKKVTQYIIKNQLKCDYRLQTNALELLQPLADKHYVMKEELEDYIKVCDEDADKRNLPYVTVFSY